jgi:predicted PurR-regulated permease PerM
MIRGRLRRRKGGGGEPDSSRDEYVEIDPSELTGLFAAPSWLRDVGLTSWLMVGVALFLVGAIWLLSLTQTIVIPVIVATVIASVAGPVVGLLQRHRLPRGIGAALLLLVIVALGIGLVVVILGGITSQFDGISGHLSDAKDTITGWLKDLGVDPTKAENAKNEASSSITDSVSALLDGLGTGISTLSSLAFFLAMTALSLFFLLMDGPAIRAWGERHAGVPVDVAHTVTQRTLEALRGYFLGVTIVAAFNGVLVFIGALILGVPLAGTLGVVTFLAGYIPYLGAWAAGAFSVLIALGGAGTDAAAGMIVVQLLANGILQQLVQPFAMGAALGIHPLAVLVVTIAGGSLFGAVGLILAAPVTSAVVKISADLARARAAEADAVAPEAAVA